MSFRAPPIDVGVPFQRKIMQPSRSFSQITVNREKQMISSVCELSRQVQTRAQTNETENVDVLPGQ